MPSTGLPTPEQLQATIDRLLQTAERCYRLARGIIDRKAIEALVRLAGSARNERRNYKSRRKNREGGDNAARITPLVRSRLSVITMAGHRA